MYSIRTPSGSANERVFGAHVCADIGGHGSQLRPDNAIHELADALKAVQRIEFPVMWNDWTLGDFKAAGEVTPAPLGAAMARCTEMQASPRMA
jgi:hypothetical protein